MSLSRLMRVTYETDAQVSEPEYRGSFSQPFPALGSGSTIVGVDWSVQGEVTVTYLIPFHGDPARWNERDDDAD